MEIEIDYKPVLSATEMEKWILTIVNEDENYVFQGEISETIYKAIKHLKDKIKELEKK